MVSSLRPPFRGRYHLLGPLSTSSAHHVYLAEDLRRRRRCALKLSPAPTPRRMAQARREYEILRHLRHPAIAEVLDFGQASAEEIEAAGLAPVPVAARGRSSRRSSARTRRPRPSGRGAATRRDDERPPARFAYLASTFHEGLDLRTAFLALFDRGGASSLGAEAPERWPAFLEALAIVCEALHAVHDHGLIHFDIKPENLLLIPERNEIGAVRFQVKILDFGLSEADTTPLSDGARGTVPYLAPELWRDQTADRRSDLFSLGVTIARAIWGRYPFAGTSAARWLASARRGRFVDLDRLQPQVPKGLTLLVRRLCAPEPDRRPADAREVRAELEQLGGFCVRRGRQVLTHALPRVAWQQPLGHVNAALDALRRDQGGGQPLVLVGAASDQFPERFLDEVVSNARADGVAVYRGGCARPFRWPYQPFAEIVQQVAADVDLDGPRFARFANVLTAIAPIERVAATPLPPLPLRDARARFVDLLSDFFLELARTGPLLLCFYGLENLSPEELAVVEALARKAQLYSAPEDEWLLGTADEPPRLLVVATYLREEADSSDELTRDDDPSELAELARQSFTHHIRLPFLDRAGAQEWLRERAPHFRPGGELLRLLLEKSAGRPRLLDEFVRLLVERDPAVDRDLAGITPELLLGLPRQSEEALVERAAALSLADRRLLDVLAVSASGLSVDELAALLAATHGRAPRDGAQGTTAGDDAEESSSRPTIDEVLDRAHALEDAGLVVVADDSGLSEVRIATRGIVERIYHQIPPERRVRLHRALASMLHGELADLPLCRTPVDVAYHAARCGDDALRAEQLILSADRLLEACAAEASIALYEELLVITEGARFAPQAVAAALVATEHRFALEGLLEPLRAGELTVTDLRLRVHARLAALHLEQQHSARALENLAILASLLADEGDALARAAVCRRMGEAYLLAGEPPNALHFLERARKFLAEVIDGSAGLRGPRARPAFRKSAFEFESEPGRSPAVVELLRTLRALARIRLERDELGQAEPLLRECMELAGTNPAHRAELCRTCIDQAEIDKRSGNHDSRTRFAGEALELARAESDPALIAEALSAVSAADIARGEYEHAIATLEERLEISEALGSKTELALCYSSLGMIHHNRSNYGAALDCYQKCLFLKRATGDKRGIANAFNNLGLVYDLHDDSRRAADCFRRAIDLFSRINDAHGIAAGMNNLSALLELEGRYDEALDYSFRALDRRRRLRSQSGVAYCQYRIGKIYRARGELEKAVNYADKALAIRRDLGEKLALAYSQAQLADLLLAQGHYRDASQLCEEALASFVELENDIGILVARETLARVLFAVGEIQESGRTLRDALQRAVGLQQRMLEGNALLSLGHVAVEKQDYDDAARRYLDAERLFRLHDSPRQLSETLLARAELALLQAKPAEALALLEEAYALLERLGIRDLVPLYFLLRSRGETARGDGDTDVAIKFLERALVETRELNLPELRWRCHHGLALLSARTGDSRLAKLHLEQAREVLDGLYAALPAGARRSFYALRERAAFQRMETRNDVLAAAEEDAPRAGAAPSSRKDDVLAGPPASSPEREARSGDAARSEVLGLVRQTLKLHDIACAMGTEADLQRLLESVMEAALELVPAERGFLLLRSPDGSETTFPFARNKANEAIDEPRDKVSASVAVRALRTGSAVLTGDALEEQPFSTTKSIQQKRLRSILCVPMIFRGDILGAIYVDNRLRTNAFQAEHVNVLQALADQAAVAVTNAHLIEDNQRRTRELEDANRQMDALNLKLRRKVQARTAQLAIAREDLRARQSQLEERYSMQNLVGESEPMRRVFEIIERVAPTALSVVLEGESGTGKELVARAIHFASPWKEGRFVSENCAGLSESLIETELFGHEEEAFTGATEAKKGLFERAHEGTLFLDEVADMPDAVQQRILRVLEEGQVRRLGGEEARPARVRLIASAKVSLRELVESGRFRADLYYRLNGLTIELPPLRERKEDIPLLAQHFLHEIGTRSEGATAPLLSAEGLRCLLAHDWPGNVRELRHTLERAALIAANGTIDRATLQIGSEGDGAGGEDGTADGAKNGTPDGADGEDGEDGAAGRDGPASAAGAKARTLRSARSAFERRFLEDSLARNRGNVSRAARAAGVSRETFYRLLRKYGIRSG